MKNNLQPWPYIRTCRTSCHPDLIYGPTLISFRGTVPPRLYILTRPSIWHLRVHVSPLLMHWRYYSLALSHRFVTVTMQSNLLIHVSMIIAPHHMGGLVWERRNSSALAMELRLSCPNPSTYDMTMTSLGHRSNSELMSSYEYEVSQ